MVPRCLPKLALVSHEERGPHACGVIKERLNFWEKRE